MLSSIRRPLVALLASLALSVLALAMWVAVLNASPPAATVAQSLAPANVAGPLYCSNWDFLNSTSQAVNDLHVRLKGVHAVTAIYTGTMNPFRGPDTSSYDPGTDVYTLNFSGAWVNESDRVHLGFCSDAPLLLLDPASPVAFEWTLTGTQVLPNPLFTGVEWSWPKRSQLHLRVVNKEAITTTLMTLQLLNAGSGYTLDDLNAATVDSLPLMLDMLPTPRTIGPSSETSFDAYFDDPAGIPPGHAQMPPPPYMYVLEAVLASEADPGDSTHLYAQSTAPLLANNLPVVQR